MKYKILTILVLFVAMQISAQITINQNDMPAPDDLIRTSTGLNIDVFGYKETGENYTWDFSQLIPITQSVDTFISITDVSFFIALYFGDKSNLVKNDNSTYPIPNIPITKQYTFFKNSNASYNNAGVLYTISGLPVPLKYNSSDVLYRFPMEYGNTGSSFAEYAFGVDNFGFISKEISRINTVDGWGTLTTPYGTFDVLRLRSEVIEFDSIYVDSIGMGLPLYREYTEYSWLGKNHKLPLLKISTSLGGTVATYLDSLRFPSAINSQQNLISKIKVFPNPSSGIINVSFYLQATSNVTIDIYNINGVKVINNMAFGKMSGEINKKINLHELGLQKGVYFVKIVCDKQQEIKRVVLY